MIEQLGGIAGVPPDPEPLRSVSPSQMDQLRACALSALWSAQRVPHALPQSPSGRLGTVAHTLFAQAGAGLLSDPLAQDIETRWEELVQAAEASMEQTWLERHLVPLRHSVAEYEVRRIQSIRLARELAQTASKTPRAKRTHRLGGYEVPVATPDGKVVGRIDELVSGPTGNVVREYKSGAIHREVLPGQLTLKVEYVTQLRLYAGMVAAMTGEWPARLEIVSVDGNIEVVPFDEDECVALLREAEALLDASNAVVNSSASASDRIDSLARPSPSACRFCSYRPLCPAYLGRGGGDPNTWPRDVLGIVSDVQRLGNGRVLLELQVDNFSTRARIVDLNPSVTRHPALGSVRAGRGVGVFNVGRAQGPSSFREGPLTTIYLFDTPSDAVIQASKCRPSASATGGGTAFAT